MADLEKMFKGTTGDRVRDSYCAKPLGKKASRKVTLDATIFGSFEEEFCETLFNTLVLANSFVYGTYGRGGCPDAWQFRGIRG